MNSSSFRSCYRRDITCIALLGVSSVICPGRCENMIRNGSFESGMDFWIQSNSYVYPQWKNTGNTSGHGATPPANNAQDGTHSINVHGRAVSQVVDVVPGGSYELKFNVGSYGSPRDVSFWGGLDLVVFQGSQIRESLTPVLMGAAPVSEAWNPSFDTYLNFEPGGNRIAWKEFTYPFRATGDQAAFVFQGGAYSFSFFTGLDAVSLQQVPEPPPLSLVAVGVICCGLPLWRKLGRARTFTKR